MIKKMWTPHWGSRGLLIWRSLLAVKQEQNFKWSDNCQNASMWIFDAKEGGLPKETVEHICTVLLLPKKMKAEVDTSMFSKVFEMPVKHSEMFTWFDEWDTKPAKKDTVLVGKPILTEAKPQADVWVSKYHRKHLRLTQWPDMSAYQESGTIKEGVELANILMYLLKKERSYESMALKSSNQKLLEIFLDQALEEAILSVSEIKPI